MEETREGRLLVRLGQIVGLLAGAVTIVYLIGAVVTYLRLSALSFHTPSTLVAIPQLPRELVISVGLTSVVLWALLFGAGYVVLRLLTPVDGLPPRRSLVREGGSSVWVVTRAAVVSGSVALLDGLIIGARWLDGSGPALIPVGVALLVGAQLIFFIVVLAYDLRSRVALRYPTYKAWNSLSAVTMTATLFAMPIVPSAALIGGTVPLPQAKACAGKSHEIGFLIGKTSDQVILGERTPPRRLASLPTTGVDELFVGNGAFDAHCPPPSQPPSTD